MVKIADPTGGSTSARFKLPQTASLANEAQAASLKRRVEDLPVSDVEARYSIESNKRAAAKALQSANVQTMIETSNRLGFGAERDNVRAKLEIIARQGFYEEPGIVGRALDIVDRPRQVSMALVGSVGSTDGGASLGNYIDILKGNDEKVLAETGIDPKKAFLDQIEQNAGIDVVGGDDIMSRTARNTINFTMDVVLDPINYVAAPAATRKLGTSLVGNVARNLSLDVADSVLPVVRSGGEGVTVFERLKSLVNDAARVGGVAEDAVDSKLSDTARLVKDLTENVGSDELRGAAETVDTVVYGRSGGVAGKLTSEGADGAVADVAERAARRLNSRRAQLIEYADEVVLAVNNPKAAEAGRPVAEAVRDLRELLKELGAPDDILKSLDDKTGRRFYDERLQDTVEWLGEYGNAIDAIDLAEAIDGSVADLMSEYADDIAYRNYAALPPDILKRFETLAPMSTPGLHIGMPFGPNFVVVPGTKGLLSTPLKKARMFRDVTLRESRLTSSAYKVWTGARGSISEAYVLNKALREGADFMGIYRLMENSVGNADIIRAGIRTEMLSATSRALEKGLSVDDAASLRRYAAQVLEKGAVNKASREVGGSLPALRRRLVAMINEDFTGMLDQDKVELLADLIMQVHSDQELGLQMARRAGLDVTRRNSHVTHALSDQGSAFINEMRRKGGTITVDEARKNPAAQLLSMIIEGGNGVTVNAATVGTTAAAKERRVGVGVFTQLPIDELRGVVRRIRDAGDAELAELSERVLRSLEEGSLSIYELNDLLEASGVLDDFASAAGQKLSGKTVRMFEESAVAASNKMLGEMAKAAHLVEYVNIGKQHGMIIGATRTIDAAEATGKVTAELVEYGKEIDEVVAVKAEKGKAVIAAKTAPVQKTVGAGKYAATIDLVSGVTSSSRVKSKLRTIDAALRKKNNVFKNIERAQRAVSKRLQKEYGLPVDVADMMAKQSTMEEIVAMRGGLEAAVTGSEADVANIAAELTSRLGLDANYEKVINDMLLDFNAGRLGSREAVFNAVPRDTTIVTTEISAVDVAHSVDSLATAKVSGVDRELAWTGAERRAAADKRTYKKAELLRGTSPKDIEFDKDAAALEYVEEAMAATKVNRPDKSYTTVDELLDALSDEDVARVTNYFDTTANRTVNKSKETLMEERARKYAQDAKAAILSNIDFSPEDAARLEGLSAQHFSDDFFRDAAIYSDSTNGEIARGFMSSKLDQLNRSVFISTGGESRVMWGRGVESVKTIKRFKQRLAAAAKAGKSLNFRNSVNRRMLEGYFYEMGFSGEILWRGDKMTFVSTVEDLANVSRYANIRATFTVEGETFNRTVKEIFDQLDKSTAKSVDEAATLLRVNEKELKAAGVYRDLNTMVKRAQNIVKPSAELDAYFRSPYVVAEDFVDEFVAETDETVGPMIEELNSIVKEFTDEVIDKNTVDPEDYYAAVDALTGVVETLTAILRGDLGDVTAPLSIDTIKNIRIYDNTDEATVWMKTVEKGLDIDNLNEGIHDALLDARAWEYSSEVPDNMARTGSKFVTPGEMDLTGPPLQGTLLEENFGEFIKGLVANTAAAYTPQGMASVANTSRIAYSVWKGQATVWRPQFHLRNLISGAYNSLIFGTGPATYAKIAGPITRFRRLALEMPVEEAALKAAKGNKEMAEALIQFNKLGIMGTTFVSSDLRAAAIDTATMAERLNPADERFALTAVGGTAMEVVEDLHRFAVFYRHYRPAVAGSELIARDMVYAAHFNYSSPTIMQTRLKKLFPFLIWTQNNIPLQMATLIEQPRMMRKYQALVNAVGGTFSDGEESAYDDFAKPVFMPNIYSSTDIVRGEGTEFWQRVMLSPDVPVNDILSLEPASVGSWANLLGNNLNPAIRTFVDYNKMKDWGYINAPAGPQQAMWLADKVPGVNLGLENPQGNYRITRFQRALWESAFPAVNEYVRMLGLETDPNRALRMGIRPEDNQLERLREGMTSAVLKPSVGLRYQIPSDTYSQGYLSSDFIKRVNDEAKRRYGKLNE